MAEPLLYYEVHGKGERCILWVHGFLSGRSHWMPNLPAFNDSYRSVVVELMGHGRSASPEDPASYAPDHYMEEFDQIREAVGADRWYTVGQSLGGALSLRYGLRHPDRVIAQAFTNSTSALGPDSFFARIRENRDASAETAHREGRSVLEEHPLNPSRARSYAADVKAELMKDYALHNPIGIAMTGQYTQPYLGIREEMKQNRVPTLMAVGEREELFREARRYAEEHVPNLTVCPLDAGHALNLQVPDAFNQAVRAFFDQHSR